MNFKCCFFLCCLLFQLHAKSQSILSQLDSISAALPYATLADSMRTISEQIKQPHLPAEQQQLIAQYNEKKQDYQQSIVGYLNRFAQLDTAAFLALNYYFNVQKDSGFLRQNLQILEQVQSGSFYIHYMREELNGLDSAQVGKIMPSISLLDKDKTIKQIPTGKKSLLLFWASWCVPCRAENSTLLENYKKIEKNGIAVISINLDETQSQWLQASKQDKIAWSDWTAGNAWNSRVARFFTIHQIPQNVLLDSDGKILARNIRIDRLY